MGGRQQEQRGRGRQEPGQDGLGPELRVGQDGWSPEEQPSAQLARRSGVWVSPCEHLGTTGGFNPAVIKINPAGSPVVLDMRHHL